MESFQISYLHWWIFAVVVFFIELMLGTEIITWLAVGASLVGVLLFFIPDIPFGYQVLIFCILSVLSALIGQFFLRKFSKETDQPNLNAYGHEYIGCSFRLIEPIVNGVGAIRVHDNTIWRVEGPDCELGTCVRVIGIHRARFTVEIDEEVE